MNDIEIFFSKPENFCVRPEKYVGGIIEFTRPDPHGSHSTSRHRELVLRRMKSGPFSGYLSVPIGEVRRGQSSREALVSHVLEQTGISISGSCIHRVSGRGKSSYLYMRVNDGEGIRDIELQLLGCLAHEARTVDSSPPAIMSRENAWADWFTPGVALLRQDELVPGLADMLSEAYDLSLAA